MRILIQRSLQSSVEVNQQTSGSIDKGFVILVGVTHDDDASDVDYCVRKIANLRLFEDEDGKTNLSLKDVQGEILSISQFSLFANTKKGNRPSFIRAAQPDHANQLYEDFNEQLRALGFKVETGEFGADMQVKIINDGPMTLLIDSKDKDW
ncbi:D-aminoacyl-tRNA deacylase [Falseniella ignava]|uniref:D-aminoacyl-tRNA deacylase n=1 Tax=Falseniella ignava CCUG 37419 TaxID=883112 RepID=K1LJM2_9LACT|nr:D-aminoacyl-tRNA deacylase [Falseniella ignava]EKB56950.1 D-tyrosyl-tRNA(Tyr) deacylase [Falseniella ignava CCUG 37419]